MSAMRSSDEMLARLDSVGDSMGDSDNCGGCKSNHNAARLAASIRDDDAIIFEAAIHNNNTTSSMALTP